MEPLIGIVALFVFGGLATYTIGERRHRARWRRSERRPVEPGGAGFRRDAGPAPTAPVLVQRRAPSTIRRTALWSIYMGQMAVPGGLLGLVGVVFGGLGLVSIPGLLLAVRIWRLGYALLRRDRGAELEARALRRFAINLNVVTVVVAVALLTLAGAELLGLSLVMLAYAAVSFAHAQAMGRCAELLAEDSRLRAEAPAQAHSKPASAERLPFPAPGSSRPASSSSAW